MNTHVPCFLLFALRDKELHSQLQNGQTFEIDSIRSCNQLGCLKNTAETKRPEMKADISVPL